MDMKTYMDAMIASHDKINALDTQEAFDIEISNRVKETISLDGQDVRIVVWDDLASAALGLPNTVVGAVGAVADKRLVVINQATVDALTPEQYRAVIFHELAHIHYNDTEINLEYELRADQYSAMNTNPKDLHSALSMICEHIANELSEVIVTMSEFKNQFNQRLDALQAMC